MSNIESAKAAIEAELSHARKGQSFYHSRIEALEKTLAQLANLSGNINSTSAATRRAAKVAGGKRSKTAKKKRDLKIASGGSELPFTGGAYWPNLVTSQPRAASQILEAAIGGLGFTPSKIQIQKLAGRMTFALNALVKSKKIQDSGSGRERRFFL